LSTGVKIAIGAVTVGALIFGIKKFIDSTSGFDFEPVRYGLPSVKGSVVILPVVVRFNNPTPLDINLNQFLANIFYLKDKTFQQVARINQRLSVPKGVSEQVFLVDISLSDIFSGGAFWTSLINTLTTKQITIRADVTANYGGIAISPKPFIQQIDIPLGNV